MSSSLGGVLSPIADSVGKAAADKISQVNSTQKGNLIHRSSQILQMMEAALTSSPWLATQPDNSDKKKKHGGLSGKAFPH